MTKHNFDETGPLFYINNESIEAFQDAIDSNKLMSFIHLYTAAEFMINELATRDPVNAEAHEIFIWNEINNCQNRIAEYSASLEIK